MPPMPHRSENHLANIAAIMAKEKTTQDQQLKEAQETNRYLRDNGVEIVDIGI
jgi:hypothetical protein